MRRRLCLLLVVLVILATGCGAPPAGRVSDGGVPAEAGHETEPNLKAGPAPGTVENPLTGQQVQAVQKLVAVVVGNNPGARPQTGLAGADLVYEIEAEGRVTRYLAFYYGNYPAVVGPVRSARTYFLPLAMEWDAYFAHVGRVQRRHG